MRTRAERRHAQAKAKAKTKWFMKTILGRADDTEARIGVWTSTHRRPCSCNLCRFEWDGVFRFKGLKTTDIGGVEMIDLGQYDAIKSIPSSEEDDERVFARFKERMDAYKQWMDLANKLPTLGEIYDDRTHRS